MIFKRIDTETALGIHAEYVRSHSPIPPPRIFEVDRNSAKFDDLWHFPTGDRITFQRDFEMHCIVRKERPDWRLTKVGIIPQQKHKFWMANRLLQEQDWFPQRGDFIFYDGYRHLITKVVIEPEAFWQQTNVWLGLVCETTLPPDGDARPVANVALPVPSEESVSKPPRTITVLPEI